MKYASVPETRSISPLLAVSIDERIIMPHYRRKMLNPCISTFCPLTFDLRLSTFFPSDTICQKHLFSLHWDN